MPLYEYECADCGHLTEVLQRLSDPPLAECPRCGGAVKKLLSAPAFQFKGSGWYVTDYARKGQGESKSAGEAKSKSGGDGDGKPSGSGDGASKGGKKTGSTAGSTSD